MANRSNLERRRFQGTVLLLAVLCACVLTVSAPAQQQEPEDPEDEKGIGLWLDQGVSAPLPGDKSLEVEFHERFDEGASNLYEYFIQAGVAFRPRSWLTLIPIYRYQRYPSNPAIAYENRLQFNITLSTSRGSWRYNLRTLIEGRFPDDRPASARLRFRPGVDYTFPLRTSWRPTAVVSNEFFIVPWFNPFANGGTSYTQNRFQVGVRLPISSSFSVRPYYMLQSVNLPAGWETNQIIGISLALKIPRKTSAKTDNSEPPLPRGGDIRRSAGHASPAPAINTTGRSRYGMGMKTAAFWIGRKWSIQTKKLGETEAHEVTIDVDKIISAKDMNVSYRAIPDQDPQSHYTLVEVSEHYRKFQGRTLSKIADFLRSMYRKDIETKQMRLQWRGVDLTWEGFDSRLMTAADGSLYKKDILFDVNDKVIMGWVGILKQGEGGRVEAGFSVIQAKRVIHGWPEAWRPTTIFGPFGTNDLVNQRLVGELELDGFEVSHTKDNIQWRGDEEEEVENKLKDAVGDYRTIASKRRGGTDQRGPAEADIKIAVAELEKELESPELVDQINLNVNVVPPQDALVASRQKVIDSIEKTVTPTLLRVIKTTPPLTIKIFLGTDLSERDAYVYQEATRETEVIVTVNQNHSFWATQLRGAESVLEYLRQCTYDALAEWQAGKKMSRFDADTIKWLKDGFLRLPMEMEQHQAEKDAAGA